MPSISSPPTARQRSGVTPREHASVTDMLKARRWVLCGIAAFCALFTGTYLAIFPVPYRSHIVIWAAPEPTGQPRGPERNFAPNLTVTRLQHLATGSAVLDRLVDTFNLRVHYGIDPDHRFAEQLVRLYLERNIRADIIDPNTLRITVSDRDRDLAAAMAMAIHDELLRLTDRETRDRIEHQLAQQEDLVNRAERRGQEQADHLLGLIDRTRTTSVGPPLNDTLREHLDLQFMSIIAALARTKEDLFSRLMVAEAARAGLARDALPPLTLIRKAEPDLVTSPRLKAALTTVTMSGLVTVLALVLMVLWHKQGPTWIQDWRAFDRERSPGTNDLTN
ncbi:MAG: hypothetical protein GFGODING_00017 [Flavobacteriales bacterium]|nr:hypothetical protein [Flavobacteriales bacterium]